MNVRTATKMMFERYSQILTATIDTNKKESRNKDHYCSFDNLLWMCSVGIEKYNEYPIDKLNRWLGFVQGVMTMNNLLDVNAERDFSRPLFHQAYKAEQTEVPPTLNM